MTSQAQEGLGARGMDRLGEMGFIDDQHATGLRELGGDAGPAAELRHQSQGSGLGAPVAMQAGRRENHQATIGRAHHRPGRRQGGEGLAQAHRIGEHGTAAGQQPAGCRPLMGEQAASIGQGMLQFGRLHQLAMRWQGWQGLPQPAQPAFQFRGGGEASAQLSLQAGGRFERELPAAPTWQPATAGSQRPQLSPGDGIEGTDHLDQAGGPETHLHQGSGQGRASATLDTLTPLRLGAHCRQPHTAHAGQGWCLPRGSLSQGAGQAMEA